MGKSDRRDAKEMGILLLIVMSILSFLLFILLAFFVNEVKQEAIPLLIAKLQDMEYLAKAYVITSDKMDGTPNP